MSAKARRLSLRSESTGVWHWLNRPGATGNPYLLAAALSMSSLCLALFVPSLRFGVSDDLENRATVSGERSGAPSPYSYQMSSIAGHVLSGLYRISPGFDWYSTVLMGGVAFAVFSGLLAVFMWPSMTSQLSRLLLAVPTYLVGLLLMIRLTYTSTSIALGCAAGALLLATFTRDRGKSTSSITILGYVSVVIASLCTSLALLFRMQGGLLALLLVAPLLLGCVVGMRRSVGILALCLCIPVGVLVVEQWVDDMAYSDARWSSWRAWFNVARTGWYGDSASLSRGLQQLVQSGSDPAQVLGIDGELLSLYVDANYLDLPSLSETFFRQIKALNVAPTPGQLLADAGSSLFLTGNPVLGGTLVLGLCMSLTLSFRIGLQLSRRLQSRTFGLTPWSSIALTLAPAWVVVVISYLIGFEKLPERLVIPIAWFLSVIVVLQIMVIAALRPRQRPRKIHRQVFRQRLDRFAHGVPSSPERTVNAVLLCVIVVSVSLAGVRVELLGAQETPRDGLVIEATKVIETFGECQTSERQCVIITQRLSGLPFRSPLLHPNEPSLLYAFWSAWSPDWADIFKQSGEVSAIGGLDSGRVYLVLGTPESALAAQRMSLRMGDREVRRVRLCDAGDCVWLVGRLG